MKNIGCNGDCPLCSGPLPYVKPAGRSAGSPGAERERNQSVRPALIAAAALLLLLGLVLRSRLQAFSSPYPEYAVFLLAYGLAGGRVLWKSACNLFRGKVMDEYFLMTAASIGAVAIGELPEAAAVMIFFGVGELLEEAAITRSRRSIAALLEARPDYANLVTAQGLERQVDPEAVRPGQLILVKPGEKVPLDGRVEYGDSFTVNAALTGESVPCRVGPGDGVLAGAINGSGLLRVKVLKEFGESSLAKIFDLVREAAGRKAKTEQFITRFARYYTPAVVLAAFLLAAAPPLLVPGAAFDDWLYRALVLLVISCPCALVISIPLGYFGGIGSASRNGILVKGGNFLEALLKVKTVVFDKTGTLTRGVFRVSGTTPAEGFTREEILYWAAHAEVHSKHPIARSIREAYPGETRPELVGRYEEIRGFGVRATVDGKTVLAGSERFLVEEGTKCTPCAMPGSKVYLAVDGHFAGCLAINDELKEDAARAVRRLKELGVKQAVMLTGDSPETAKDIAARVGVDEYRAGLLPGDKVEWIEALLAGAAAEGRGGKLAFVGDGINDAPALTRADVGIAMGGIGSDAAIEAADVVIMDDRPVKLARAMEIAAFTRKVVIQNIVLALGIKGFFVALGSLGLASIWGAVFADVGVALLAIINATRALRFNPPQ